MHRLPARGRPGRRRRDDEPHRARSPGTWSRCRRAPRRSSPTAWTTRCWSAMPDGTARARPHAPTAAGRRADRPPQRHLRRGLPGASRARCATCAGRSACWRTGPWIGLWAELAVLAPPHRLAHSRDPRRTASGQLAEMPARLRDCALSHAVDAAVAGPSAVLSAGPGELAAPCPGRHERLPGGGRSAVVTRSSSSWRVRTGGPGFSTSSAQPTVPDPAAGRHPSSADWERATGARSPAPRSPSRWPPSCLVDADLASLVVRAARVASVRRRRSSGALGRTSATRLGWGWWPAASRRNSRPAPVAGCATSSQRKDLQQTVHSLCQCVG